MTVRRWKGGGMIKIMGGGSGDEPKRMPFGLRIGILFLALMCFACTVVGGIAHYEGRGDDPAFVIVIWGLLWVLWDIHKRWHR